MIEKLHGRVAEVVSRSFAQEVSEDHGDYWDTDDGSWLCATYDIDEIADKIHKQHRNGQPISPAPSPPQPDSG